MSKKSNVIADKLGEEEILCQLSEECAELIQACLKYRRATKGLTPKTLDETKDNIIEELSDVLLNINQLVYLFDKHEDINGSMKRIISDIREKKTDRWYRRTFITQEEC
jgi:NTP pyrophosphatase (non-canonical NTP hydrolase)